VPVFHPTPRLREADIARVAVPSSTLVMRGNSVAGRSRSKSRPIASAVGATGRCPRIQ
jgi:hypothetical protein